MASESEEIISPFKQWEGESQKVIKAKGRELDGVIHNGYPAIAA